MNRLNEICSPDQMSDWTLRSREFSAAVNRLKGKSLHNSLPEVSAEFLQMWDVLPRSPRGFWVVAVASEGQLASLAVVDLERGKVRTDYFSIDETCSLSDIKLVYITRAQLLPSSAKSLRLEAYLQTVVSRPRS